MKRIDSLSDIGISRSSRYVERQPQGRELEERDRRRREWMRQQEREREHERLKRKKIEEYERKRKAKERENELMKHGGRSSHRSNDVSKSKSPEIRRKDESPKASTSKTSVMSQKFESLSNNARLFKGPEGTKIEMTDLHRIKVDIHRKVIAGEICNELQRDIIDPEDVKVKRREGEGSKPIFEREELKKSEIPIIEVEEYRTVVAIDDHGKETRHSTKRRGSATPTSPTKRASSGRRHLDDRHSRYENSRHNADRSTNRKHESDKDRGRSHENRSRRRSLDNRERRSPRRTSHHDTGRGHRDHGNRSHSGDRESRRSDTRNRSSRDTLPYRDYGERSRDDSRERRIPDDRSRERRIQMSHHYAEAMPVPVYYESFHPRPIMVGPMMPIRGPMPIGRGRMPLIMGPMRPPYAPRFLPPDMFRPSPHPNPRFSRMF